MGLRLRLKAGFSLAGYRGQALVILRALKRYGLIVADNGSSWYITGAPDPRWNDADLDQLKQRPRARPSRRSSTGPDPPLAAERAGARRPRRAALAAPAAPAAACSAGAAPGRRRRGRAARAGAAC